MKSGFLPKEDRQARDEVIAGTDKDPTLLGVLPDADPETVVEDETARSRPPRSRSRPARASRRPWADRGTVARLRRAAQAALDVMAQAPARLAQTTLAERAPRRRPPAALRDGLEDVLAGAEPAEPLPPRSR